MIPFWSYNNGPAPEITATGFSVSLEQAKELMKKEGEIPSFAEITRGRGEAFSAVAKTQAFQIKPTIERQDYQTFLKIFSKFTPWVKKRGFTVNFEGEF